MFEKFKQFVKDNKQEKNFLREMAKDFPTTSKNAVNKFLKDLQEGKISALDFTYHNTQSLAICLMSKLTSEYLYHQANNNTEQMEIVSDIESEVQECLLNKLDDATNILLAEINMFEKEYRKNHPNIPENFMRDIFENKNPELFNKCLGYLNLDTTNPDELSQLIIKDEMLEIYASFINQARVKNIEMTQDVINGYVASIWNGEVNYAGNMFRTGEAFVGDFDPLYKMFKNAKYESNYYNITGIHDERFNEVAEAIEEPPTSKGKTTEQYIEEVKLYQNFVCDYAKQRSRTFGLLASQLNSLVERGMHSLDGKVVFTQREVKEKLLPIALMDEKECLDQILMYLQNSDVHIGLEKSEIPDYIFDMYNSYVDENLVSNIFYNKSDNRSPIKYKDLPESFLNKVGLHGVREGTELYDWIYQNKISKSYNSDDEEKTSIMLFDDVTYELFNFLYDLDSTAEHNI